MRVSVVVAAVLIATAVRPARADDVRASYWSVSLLGGALVPLPGMNDTHQPGLLAGARIGWTSKLGLGLEVAASYSPLPRKPMDEVTYESHYGAAALGPTFTLGRHAFRLTLAGSAGAAYEQTRVHVGGGDVETRRVLPLASGGARLELHVISGGGFVLGGGVTQTFGDAKYRYAETLGGLILTF